MSKVKIEVFFSTSVDSKNTDISELLREIEEEFGDEVEIVIYEEHNELFKEYNLTVTPAVVVEELIKIIGVCPSKESLVSALRATVL